MKILVDADGCDVIKSIESIAKNNNHISVVLFSDASRIISSDYSEVRVVDIGRDSADFAILHSCEPSDIVVTHDYGLASMALSMKCKAIHPFGRIYTTENIGKLLADRHLARNFRKSHKGGRGRYKPVYSKDCKQGHFNEHLQQLIDECTKLSTVESL